MKYVPAVYGIIYSYDGCCSWCMKINCDFTCNLLTSEPIRSVVVIKHNLIPNLRMRKAMATPGRWYVHLATNLIGIYLTGSSVPKLDDTVNWWAKGQTRNIETSGLWTFDETPFMIDSQLPFWKRSVKHKTSYQQTRLWISHNHQVSNPVLFFFLSLWLIFNFEKLLRHTWKMECHRTNTFVCYFVWTRA